MKQFTSAIASAVALYAAAASASVATYTPTTGITFSIGIPSSSASSNSGNIYFQITAPTTYSWVALGQGSQMSGSNMFIMYQDGSGNVTISPRKGTFHSTPQADTSAEVTLLAGSGVSGKVMTANVRCANCESWSGGSMNLQSTKAGWIGAWKSGSAIDSSSISANIQEHDDHAQFQVDLTTATISSDANPFVGSSSSGDNSGSGSGSGSDDGSGSGSGSSGSGSSGSGSSGVTGTVGSDDTKRKALVHGILMSVVWVALYPLGALLMPLIGRWYIHAGWQVIAFVGMWVGFGLGLSLAQEEGILFKQAHTEFGTALVCLMVLQPALGFAHHSYYKKHSARGAVSHAHIWYGRILMALGIVNGGLGLQLASSPTSFKAAYIVVAVAITGLYTIVTLIKGLRRKRVVQRKPFNGDSPHQSDEPRELRQFK